MDKIYVAVISIGKYDEQYDIPVISFKSEAKADVFEQEFARVASQTFEDTKAFFDKYGIVMPEEEDCSNPENKYYGFDYWYKENGICDIKEIPYDN